MEPDEQQAAEAFAYELECRRWCEERNEEFEKWLIGSSEPYEQE